MELFNLLKATQLKTKGALQFIFGHFNDKKWIGSIQYSYLMNKYCRNTLLSAIDLCKGIIID